MKYLIKTNLFILAVFLPLVLSAHDFEVDGIYYLINGTNATVTFKGTSASQYSNEYSGAVSIPPTVSFGGVTYTVTAIGQLAFFTCNELTSIVIPNTVTEIGYSAFYHCDGMMNIEIPNSVTSIGNEAFIGCSRLKNIEIPNSVISVGINTFYGCSSLKNIVIPNSLTTISAGMFCRCTGLTSVVIPNSVTTIATCAFLECTELACIEIPNSVTKIGGDAFRGTAWYNNQPDGLIYAGLVAYKYKGSMPEGETICLKDGTTYIASEAFYNCSNLANIEIPNTVAAFDNYAFYGCSSLRSIIIPNSVTSIGYNTFGWCSGLRVVVIPNSVTNIDEDVFYKCDHITALMITGDGEWQGGYIDCSTNSLYIDDCITSIKGIKINPKRDIYSYASLPPTCDENTFTNFSAKLHVPAVSIAAYFTADYWSNFANITGNAVKINEINLTQTDTIVSLGSQFILTASVSPNNADFNANVINWITTNETVAILTDKYIIGNSSECTVTAVGVGECDIIVQYLDKKAVCHVVVNNDMQVIITLDQHEVRIQPNEIITLTPTFSSYISPELVVTSSDPTVAAARITNDKVQIVGIKEGTATITVGSDDGLAEPDSCIVIVYRITGDVNGDSEVNIADVNLVIDHIFSGNFTEQDDVNGDGEVNIADVNAIIDAILKY